MAPGGWRWVPEIVSKGAWLVSWRRKKCRIWERYSPRTNRVCVLAVDVVSDVGIQKLKE
jgi:hypothetical protein